MIGPPDEGKCSNLQHIERRYLTGMSDPTERPKPPPLRGKQLSALRAIASTPAGLRVGAYPTALPLLVAMGLVIKRPASRVAHRDGRAWFLTSAGRETVRAYGEDEA